MRAQPVALGGQRDGARRALQQPPRGGPASRPVNSPWLEPTTISSAPEATPQRHQRACGRGVGDGDAVHAREIAERLAQALERLLGRLARAGPRIAAL